MLNSRLCRAGDYISKAQAWKYTENKIKRPFTTGNGYSRYLPASLEVSAKSIDDLPKVKVYFDGTAGVDEVIYQQDIIEALKKWSEGLGSGISLTGVLS